MNESEKMQRAKMYIDKLANGINPLDDTAVSDDDIINNSRISRCLVYVSDILEQVINSTCDKKNKKKKKEKFRITYEEIEKYPFSNTPVKIEEIAKKLNALVDREKYNRITKKNLTNWLVDADMLYLSYSENGKIVKRPTIQGMVHGITMEERAEKGREYKVVVYDREAQQFIIDNMDAIIARIKK